MFKEYIRERSVTLGATDKIKADFTPEEKVVLLLFTFG